MSIVGKALSRLTPIESELASLGGHLDGGKKYVWVLCCSPD